tara:strand:+ start:3115 stop:4116 length:1002 start_codon:yes stop_codon:yes gene_type:complete
MKKTIIIAEGGVNHNGKVSLAKKIITKAKEVGADYIKFQLYDADALSTSKANKADYQKKFNKNETQKEMLKKYQMSLNQMLDLRKFARKKKIKFMLSVFDNISVKNLEIFKLDYIKIPSGEIDNFPMLAEVTKINSNIIISTGMSTVKEIKKTLHFLKKRIRNNKKIFVLHCNSSYPTPPEDVNIGVIDQFKKIFGPNIGFSDHTIGPEASILAVAKGAKIIEKHVTLDRKMDGPDHSSSLDFKQFKSFVSSIRKVEKFFSSQDKIITKSEKKNIQHVRKSIVAKEKIIKGEKFSLSKLTIKRPGSGLKPAYIFKLIKKKSKYNFKKDDLIRI